VLPKNLLFAFVLKYLGSRLEDLRVSSLPGVGIGLSS
jgi:hypothetical protein